MSKFTLPSLPYNYAALEPHIDARTMAIHHGKHHQSYLDKLNTALEKHPKLFEKSVEELLSDLNSIPENIRVAVKNNGGGHYHHSLFWNFLSPTGGGEPSGALAVAINSAFGDFASFQEKFSAVAMGQFASGWAWLVKENSELKIISTPNQDSPVSSGLYPILGLDVWEHAYYLNYQNRRADYINAWWNILNWPEAEKRFLEK